MIITNYHKLAGWATTLEGHVESVVFDECQELRRSESAKYSAARQIARACKYRLSLTATPTYNFGSEIWNVIDVIGRDALGSREEFEREFVRPNLWNELGSHLREKGIMLRRTKADVGRELPPVTQVPHTIDCDAKILDNIKGSAAALARMILSESPVADTGEYFRSHGEFDVLMRRATGVAKAPYVADFVKILLQSGESVVLYGWHHAVYDIWRESLKEFNPVFFTGEETPGQKDEAKRLFVEGKTKLLIISLRAGAGLDGLQHVCSVCVFGELDWSSGVITQCIGRISRDGQDKPVTAYFMLSETGADPVMSDVLEVKGQQGHAIRDPFTDLAIRTENSADHVKKLAAHYLRSIGAQEEAKVFEEEIISA